jgi:hypothetical protein
VLWAVPYGTACQHEHACLRCQMLSVNPKMLPRLDELEEDLISRRERTISEGWHGEVEGLELTLTFLRSKRDQTRRAASMGTVSPGHAGGAATPSRLFEGAVDHAPRVLAASPVRSRLGDFWHRSFRYHPPVGRSAGVTAATTDTLAELLTVRDSGRNGRQSSQGQAARREAPPGPAKYPPLRALLLKAQA